MYTIILSLNNLFVQRLEVNDYQAAKDYCDKIVNHLFGGCDTAEVYTAYKTK